MPATAVDPEDGVVGGALLAISVAALVVPGDQRSVRQASASRLT